MNPRIAIVIVAVLGLAGPALADGVSLDAKPRARDQVVSFYTARGFTATAIAPYADACVVSFTFRNDGKGPLRFRLADWRASDGTALIPLEAWDSQWRRDGVAEPARIAFRWAQFPTEQEFEPGDWIMGMAAFERRPAGAFRVVARYADEKGQHEVSTESIACVAD